MTLILVLLTAMACIGIKSLTKRGRPTRAAEESKIWRRDTWRLTEEAFSKC